MAMNRLTALAVGIAFCLTTQASFGQCSGGGGGGSGRSGFGMPTSSNATAYSNQQYNPGVSSNNAAFAVAMQSQRQQMELMNQQMMMQQMQLESMRQQMIAKQASDAKARQDEMIALRKERNKEKEQKSAARLASTKAKKTSLN